MLQITFSLTPDEISFVLIEQCVYHRDSLTIFDIVLCLFNSYEVEIENCIPPKGEYLGCGRAGCFSQKALSVRFLRTSTNNFKTPAGKIHSKYSGLYIVSTRV